MIGKIKNLPYQKTAKTIHDELDQNKRHASQHRPQYNSNQNSRDSDSDFANTSIPDASREELIRWMNELNLLECYASNNLKFSLMSESRHNIIQLQDKNSHTLQEYLPVQFKALYLHLKEDKDNPKKGTILNLSC